MRFVQPDEHTVLVFLVQLALLLGVARVLGQICRRFGQPAVVGELAAGVVLGPSVLGNLAPGVFDWIFPPGAVQSAMLFTVGWIGVLLLLMVTGFETDLKLIARLGRAVAWVTAGALIVPFAFGLAGGYLMPDSLIGPESDRSVFALFLATALTISSLPVIAKIMSELGLMRRNFGQLTLAVGMTNDVIGWVALGLIAGLAQAGGLQIGDLLTTVIGLAVFLALAAVLGQRIVDRVLQTMRRYDVGLGGWITVALVFVFGLGSITQWLGVEGVLGAFIAGILLGRSRYSRHDLEERLETFASAFVAPIFFATAGLRIDLALLGDVEVLLWAIVVLLLASLSKFGGSMIGARLARLEWREGAALGVGLNARGALEIVIATVGLSLGVLNDASYTIVVLMAIVTSMMAPPLLRLVVRGWAGTPEEQQRLALEEQYARAVLVKPTRVLLPTRGGPTSTYAARVLAGFLPSDSPITLLTVNGANDADGADGHDLSPTRVVLSDYEIETETLRGAPEQLVSRQASLGYGLLVAGISPIAESRSMPPLARAMVLETGLPTVLVRPHSTRGRGADAPDADVTVATEAPRRVLVPISPTVPSQAALEVGIALARRTGAELLLLYIGEVPLRSPTRRIIRATLRTLESVPVANTDLIGTRILDAAIAQARAVGVQPVRVLRTGSSKAQAIVSVAQERQADLVVLGVAAREIDGHPFLGQTVERVVNSSDAGLAIVCVPTNGSA